MKRDTGLFLQLIGLLTMSIPAVATLLDGEVKGVITFFSGMLIMMVGTVLYHNAACAEAYDQGWDKRAELGDEAACPDEYNPYTRRKHG